MTPAEERVAGQARGSGAGVLFICLCPTYSLFSLSPLLPLLAWLPSLLQDTMENRAMYLHTVSDRDTGSIFEEPFDGRSLSKLDLCEDGECFWLGSGV